MKSLLTSISFSLLAGIAYNQSLDAANQWFDRYEYGLASNSYEQINDKGILKSEDYQRWCYSYFLSGNYAKSLALSDSLLKDEKTPSYFYYVNGFSAFVSKDYVKAKQSFISYQKKDTVCYVDSLISACDVLPTWQNQSYVKFENNLENNDKSDFNGQYVLGKPVFFHEGGRDGKKRINSNDSLAYSEIMFSLPFIVSDANKEVEVCSFPPLFSMSNITSFTLDTLTREVYVTVSNPLSDSALFQAPHLYQGVLESDGSIKELTPWTYSGFEDSSSTAQATINQAGNLLIYTKESKKTKNADLYYSKKENGNWSTPKPITSLNTVGDDMFPFLIGDTLLTFASNARVGYGGLDIYQVLFNKNMEFKSVEHLKAPINGYDDDFALSYLPGSNAAYFSSNRKEGAKGDDDIFYIQFNYPDTSSKEKEKFVHEWEDIIVYFDLDKFNLDKAALEKLEAAKKYLADGDELFLDIEGHTDARATEQYNITLGENRSNSVAEYLIAMGYAKNDLTTSSKGEKDPAVICKLCTEEDYRLNRFVIIKLKKK